MKYMKIPDATCLFFLFVLLITGCQQDSKLALLKFTAYKHNPVLSPGAFGAWDNLAVLLPYVIVQDKVFYMFYMGWQINGQGGIGIATSADGYHFTKYVGNPVLSASEMNFDSYTVGPSVILKEDSIWVMYYGAGETAIYGPPPYIGRATAKALTGPWVKSDSPVMTVGGKSEWDGGFIFPNSILKLDDDGYRMYYTAGTDFVSQKGIYIGMASSIDGITWKKYNDPETTEHPYADSDPVLTNARQRKQVNDRSWCASVYKTTNGYEMYFEEEDELNYATSLDGIHWERYPGNPFYMRKYDPYVSDSEDVITLEFPSLVRNDSIYFMYYDYGTVICRIGMATAPVK